MDCLDWQVNHVAIRADTLQLSVLQSGLLHVQKVAHNTQPVHAHASQDIGYRWAA